ncbi:hypothetical protein FOA43_001519 [Brettanomyces nanus]|uniref:Uncharacterized protein n=1 Tax=Eeniella nana TaxID=13502 RepID=A0A875S1I3_EENNA|nr:uncharacterized protein FOA43_001519 [Brettanomyces nanus]QPG74195.1 hypothetical protein FOA43_001519 [Brettanomyces nanus]
MTEPFQVLLTIPHRRPEKNAPNVIPFTLHVSKVGGNAPLGAYVYSIVDIRASNDKVYQTLLNNATEELLDLTKKLGSLLSMKYSVPSYVSISGDISLEEFVPLSKEVFELIEKSY